MTGPTTRRFAAALPAAFLLAALPIAASAATPVRVSHTATLLTTGDVLIAGGLDGTGVTQFDSYIIRTSIGQGPIATIGDMGVARASHTATMMPNGCVFVAGGNISANDTTVTVTNTTKIYDPGTGTWSNGPNMGTARYNHTSTLLNDGRILICGGSDALGNAIAACDIYSPTSCLVGTMSGSPPSMLQGRFNHTALLLKDGRVWFAGGVNPLSAAPPGYLSTTERFDPATDTFQSASPLIEARSQHTATLMGDGKALVVGGFNRRDVVANTGITESAEIYDPISNSVAPAAQMSARRHAHGAVLSANGTVEVFGGLGNITTSYVNPSSQVDDGSSISFGAPTAVSATQSTTAITGGSISIPLNFLLNKPVSGVIEDGEMWLSSPTIKAPWGSIDFTPAEWGATGAGIRVDLAGQKVDCNDLGVCGRVITPTVPGHLLSNLQGSAIFYVRTGFTPTDVAPVSGSLSWSGTLTPSTSFKTLTGGTLTADVTVSMDNAFIGHSIPAGAVFTISDGTMEVKKGTFSVVLTGGSATSAGSVTVNPDVDGNGEAVFSSLSFTSLTGTIEDKDPNNPTAGQYASPYSIVSADKATLTLRMRYVTDGADLDKQVFNVDIATVIIRKMVMADRETYDPKANSWSLTTMPGTVDTNQRYGQSATLLPNDDSIYYGGRACSGATCATRPATSSPLIQLVRSEKNFRATTGTAGGQRAFHTTTLLPNGDLLIAGGTNGPSVLSSAEIFNPATETFTPSTGSMRYVRDLHTATLLPNGRVLIAGGFTTNAASTGSTNTAEIYYPDTRLFIETLPMISSRSNHTAIVLPNGNVFVAGGFGPGDVITGTSEIYISTKGIWIPAATMPSVPDCRRAISAAVQLKNGKILLIGGVNVNGPMTSSALYDPTANTWDCTTVTAIPTPLRSHSATLLFDGRVLVSGGNDGVGEANVSYIYDPVSNTWTTTGVLPLTQPRFNHTATLLPNGNVTISGGSQRFGEIPTTLETYHVNASSWVVGPTPVTFNTGARAFHTMTLALNNRLYGIGGSDGVIGGNGVSLYNSAESGYFTSTPDAFSKNSPPSFRQATITSAVNTATPTAPLIEGGNLTVTGTQFKGGTEASGGGAASANSAFSYPHLVLQQVDGSGGAAAQSNGGFVVDLTTQIYVNPANASTLDTSVTVPLPATTAGLPYGWYALRVGANDVYSAGTLIQAGPPKPSAAPTGISGVATGTSTIQWNWTAVGGVDGYNVYNATTGVFITTIAATGSPSFVESSLEASATTSIIIAGYTLSGDGPLAYSPTSYTQPNPPSLVTIASVTADNLLLYWSINGNAYPGTTYEVTQSSDNFVTDVSTPIPQIFNYSEPYTTISNLTANTAYFFRVRAFNLGGVASAYSGVATATTRAPVTQPVVAARTSTSIDWGWADPGGVINYRVYNATSGVLLATPASNSYSEVGLGTNTIHSIIVSAVTGAGEGPLSPSATAYSAAASPGFFNPPAVPSTGTIVINWTNNGNPPQTVYTATLAELDGGGNPLPGAVSASTAGFNVGFGTLDPSAQYLYTIVAFNGDNIPSDSPATVFGSTWTLPVAPSPLTTVGTTPTTISVAWATNNNGSSTTYEVTYTTDNFVTSVSTAIAFAANFGGNNATITGLVTGATYSVRVIASNPFGRLSQFSNIITTRTFNGGAPLGSIQGLLLANSDSTLFGSLGNAATASILIRAPAHTFPTDVQITISSLGPAGLPCPNGTNTAFSITDSPALQPIGSLYFTFHLDASQLGAIPTSRALLLRYEPVSNTCVPLETTFNSATSEMTARINHFSTFQVGSVPASASAESARIFPNPYYTGRDGYVTIDNVPANARVRIFTLRGELVLDVKANAAGVLTWSGTNGFGRSVASGVYVVMVESGSTKKILKLAVIR